MLSKPVRRLLVFITVMGAIGMATCGGGFLFLRNAGVSRAHLYPVDVATVQCLTAASSLSEATALRLKAEWITRDDLVGILNSLVNRGWRPLGFSMTMGSVEAIPPESTTWDLRVLKVRIFPGVRLSYTDERTTRVMVLATVGFCPP